MGHRRVSHRKMRDGDGFRLVEDTAGQFKPLHLKLRLFLTLHTAAFDCYAESAFSNPTTTLSGSSNTSRDRTMKDPLDGPTESATD